MNKSLFLPLNLNIMRVLILVLFGFVVCLKFTFAQDSPDLNKEDVITATELLSKKKFGVALNKWKDITSKFPDNSSYQFKLGMCQRAIPEHKGNALKSFRKAVIKIDSKYDFFNASIDHAPYDAVFFLAEAYLYNNKPDSAIDQFLRYKDLHDQNPPIEVEKHIRMCRNAENGVNHPRNVSLKTMGKILNSDYNDQNPVISLDNNTIFFATDRPHGMDLDNFTDESTGNKFFDIFISIRGENGKWQEPKSFKFNTPYDDFPLYLGADGTLYLSRKSNGESDLFQSKFFEGVWHEPEMLASGISSGSMETGISVSANKEWLFFTSTRPDGYGKSDIYKCKRKNETKWGKPVNLGSIINTDANEFFPFIHPNGNTLFFISNGYMSKGMGGYDIYFTEIQSDGNWGAPVNMGYPINNSKDNMNYYIGGSGMRYTTVMTENKKNEIYYIEGGGFDFENIELGTKVVNLVTEMDVMDVMEVEKEVLKEVEVVEVVEKEVEVEKLIKEVEVIEHEVEMVEIVDSETGEVIGTERRVKEVRDSTYRENMENEDAKAKRLAERELAVADSLRTVFLADSLKSVYIADSIRTAFVADSLNEVKILAEKAEKEKANKMKTALDEKESTKSLKPDPSDELDYIYDSKIHIYHQYFGYNQKGLYKQSSGFNRFLEDLKMLSENNGKVVVTIESSASRVPTRQFENNTQLAVVRAKEAQSQIKSALKQKGIDESLVDFEVTTLVQGPSFKNDVNKNKVEYQKYQYIKLVGN